MELEEPAEQPLDRVCPVMSKYSTECNPAVGKGQLEVVRTNILVTQTLNYSFPHLAIPAQPTECQSGGTRTTHVNLLKTSSLLIIDFTCLIAKERPKTNKWLGGREP